MPTVPKTCRVASVVKTLPGPQTLSTAGIESMPWAIAPIACALVCRQLLACGFDLVVGHAQMLALDVVELPGEFPQRLVSPRTNVAENIPHRLRHFLANFDRVVFALLQIRRCHRSDCTLPERLLCLPMLTTTTTWEYLTQWDGSNRAEGCLLSIQPQVTLEVSESVSITDGKLWVRLYHYINHLVYVIYLRYLSSASETRAVQTLKAGFRKNHVNETQGTTITLQLLGEDDYEEAGAHSPSRPARTGAKSLRGGNRKHRGTRRVRQTWSSADIDSQVEDRPQGSSIRYCGRDYLRNDQRRNRTRFCSC